MNKINLIQFIKENHESLLMVLDLIPNPIFIKDVNGQYLSCNVSFEKFCGLTRQELINKSVHDLWEPSQADVFFAKDQALFDNPGLQVYETNFTNPEGMEYIFQYHKVTFDDADKKIAGLLGIIFDITEMKQLEQSLSKLSQIDELTQIYNRRAGFEQMNRVLEDSIRKNRVFSIALIDIDHFKQINDIYGHATGDSILKIIATDLDNLLRGSEIFFRHGGEEFIVCMPEATLNEAKVIAERLRIRVASEKVISSTGESLDVTLSLGISVFPEHGTHLEQLIHASDEAMYEAKKSGRNCVKVASKVN